MTSSCRARHGASLSTRWQPNRRAQERCSDRRASAWASRDEAECRAEKRLQRISDPGEWLGTDRLVLEQCSQEQCVIVLVPDICGFRVDTPCRKREAGVRGAAQSGALPRLADWSSGDDGHHIKGSRTNGQRMYPCDAVISTDTSVLQRAMASAC